MKSIIPFDSKKPLNEARMIPSSWYTDEQVYKKELDHVFGDNWIIAARADQLREPGDFVTTRIGIEPVIVVRDKDMQLHAFSNICRHRAAHVECANAGKKSRFMCRYHGWAYDLTGRIAGTPEVEETQFDKKQYRLPKFAVGEFNSFVFVNLKADAAPLLQQIDPMPNRDEFVSTVDMKWAHRKEFSIDCNWKLFIDNYLDGGYHIRTLHPSLAKLFNMENYETLVFNKTSLQTSPLGQSQNTKDQILNETRKGQAFYWWVYPNLMINIYEDSMDVNIVVPQGPAKCTVIFDYYFSKHKVIQSGTFIDDSIKVADLIQDEDMEICNEIQKNLYSKYYSQGPYCARREASDYQFHKLLANDVQGLQ